MRHIKIFETFNSQKSPVCQIEFTTCIPYNCDDFTGNWTIEKHHILVDVEVSGVMQLPPLLERNYLILI